jgi:hypothetical protein
MTWNNRIFKHVDNGSVSYALHETFYNEMNGKIEGWTEEPVSEYSTSIDELIQDLEQKLEDAKRFRNSILLFDASPEINNSINSN